jgi:hypothetical protein
MQQVGQRELRRAERLAKEASDRKAKEKRLLEKFGLKARL